MENKPEFSITDRALLSALSDDVFHGKYTKQDIIREFIDKGFITDEMIIELLQKIKFGSGTDMIIVDDRRLDCYRLVQALVEYSFDFISDELILKFFGKNDNYSWCKTELLDRIIERLSIENINLNLLITSGKKEYITYAFSSEDFCVDILINNITYIMNIDDSKVNICDLVGEFFASKTLTKSDCTGILGSRIVYEFSHDKTKIFDIFFDACISDVRFIPKIITRIGDCLNDGLVLLELVNKKVCEMYGESSIFIPHRKIFEIIIKLSNKDRLAKIKPIFSEETVKKYMDYNILLYLQVSKKIYRWDYCISFIRNANIDQFIEELEANEEELEKYRF